MPVIPIPNIAQSGMLPDVSQMAMPLNGVVQARNVRFVGNSVVRSGGFNPALAYDPTPASDVRKLHRHINSNSVETLYMFQDNGRISQTIVGEEPTYVTPVGHVDLTGDGITTSASLAMLPYFTAEDTPVVGKGSAPGAVFEPVMATTPHEDSTWRVIRSHKDRLFVLNETTTGATNPQRVQWSGPVGNEELATDWDTASPASTSGWLDLVGFSGPILDAQPLGEFLYIYGSEGISRMWESGDEFVFNNNPVMSQDGVLTTGCVVPVSGFGHFVVGRDSIYIFDGQQATPVAHNRVEKFFRSRLNTTLLDRVFAYADHANHEVWVCYPANGTQTDYNTRYFGQLNYATEALVWDYRHNVWSFRDIPNLRDMVTWSVSTDYLRWEDMTAEAWAATNGTWVGASGSYISLPTGYSQSFTYGGTTRQSAIVRFDAFSPPTNDYNNPVSELIRYDLNLESIGINPWYTKLLRRFNMGFDTGGLEGEPITVIWGSRRNRQGPFGPSFGGPYDAYSDNWLNTRMMGQAFAYIIRVSGETPMRLSSMYLDIDQMADR